MPADALMGRENDGFRVAVGELAGGRIGVAALSLGIARAAMDAAKAYVKERRQFGQAVAEFQGIQWMIADREVDLEAARLLILQAAHLKDQGQPFAKAASMAKLFASEAAHRATDTAIQLHGGAGYIRDYRGRAPRPRRPHHPHLRGHVGDPAADHRARDAAAVSASAPVSADNARGPGGCALKSAVEGALLERRHPQGVVGRRCVLETRGAQGLMHVDLPPRQDLRPTLDRAHRREPTGGVARAHRAA